jgi:hypothetical protein
LILRNQRCAVGLKWTDEIAHAGFEPRRDRAFPAQAQVAAWVGGSAWRAALGWAGKRPNWAAAGRRAKARRQLLLPLSNVHCAYFFFGRGFPLCKLGHGPESAQRGCEQAFGPNFCKE